VKNGSNYPVKILLFGENQVHCGDEWIEQLKTNDFSQIASIQHKPKSPDAKKPTLL